MSPRTRDTRSPSPFASRSRRLGEERERFGDPPLGLLDGDLDGDRFRRRSGLGLRCRSSTTPFVSGVVQNPGIAAFASSSRSCSASSGSFASKEALAAAFAIASASRLSLSARTRSRSASYAAPLSSPTMTSPRYSSTSSLALYCSTRPSVNALRGIPGSLDDGSGGVVKPMMSFEPSLD